MNITIVLSKLFSSPLPFPQLREHLAKGQRTLAGEGMSQIVRSLLELMSRHSYYSGDLLFSVEILRNVTDTFKRATYIPAPDDVQVDRTHQHTLTHTQTNMHLHLGGPFFLNLPFLVFLFYRNFSR